MTIRERLSTTLENSGPMCDDCLAAFTAIKPRQTVNARCRELHSEGHISRLHELCPRCKVIKLVNHPGITSMRPVSYAAVPQAMPDPHDLAPKPWFWEGHIQASLVRHLNATRWQVISNANTATREPGKDIVAKRDGVELWISVKGWPQKSVNTQARHWFAGALFDLILYRDLDPDVSLGIGIPAGYSTYENLMQRVRWLRRNLPFTIFTVAETGAVRVIEPTEEQQSASPEMR